MNNSNAITDLVNKIPIYIYFEELPDRKQSLKYLEWLIKNVPEVNTVDTNKLYREIISRQLRMVTMKIIEPEILLVIALNNITLTDFTISSDELIKKVIAENIDKYDLDILQRVMAQIMSKLPKDLRERVTGKHKMQIFQLLAKHVKMDNKLLEKFMEYDKHMLTMELDSGDYNTLNQKYLSELYEFDQKQPYLNSTSMEYGALASKMMQNNTTTTKPITFDSPQPPIRAQYIDNSPEFMIGDKDGKLYYFDSTSGTISEFPLYTNQQPVSIADLQTILASSKINQDDIQKVINNLKTPTPTETIPVGFFDSLEKMFTGLTTGDTQKQEILTTKANLNNSTPIPPAFLTKLYNIKNQNQNNNYNSNYNSINSKYNDYNTNYNTNYNDLNYNERDYLNGSNIKNSDITPKGERLHSNDKLKSSAGAYTGLYSTTTTTPIKTVASKPTVGTISPYTDSYLLPHPTQIQPLTQLPQTPQSNYPTKTYREFSGSVPEKTRGNLSQLENNINRFKLLQTTHVTNSTTTTAPPTTTTAQPTITIAPPNTTNAQSISGFSNMNSNNSEIANNVSNKIKDTNKKIENLAIGFITILILLFLVVIINSIKNN